MKVVFGAMGEMNMGTASVSAVLKEGGHETAMAFDPSLFDEHLYFNADVFPFKQLAKLFDQKEKVIEKIVALEPDLVAFGVISDTYQWAIQIAEGVKKRIDVPIVFAGLFATNCPETPLETPWVDMVCMGEGEYPMLELCNSMEKGEIDLDIPNFVFKTPKGFKYNPVRPLNDMNELPVKDMDLFDDDVRIGNRYYILSSKGCVISCSYCSQAFYEEFNGTRDPRRRAVDLIIDELVEAKKRWDIKLIDFEDNILYSNKKWFREFAHKYKEKVGIPYICMGYPASTNEEVAELLALSGCYRVQIGIQSMNPETRTKYLHRPETNEQIRACFDAMDKFGVKYSCDHIFGLPNELNAESLEYAAREYSKCDMIHKVNTFFLTLYPKTPMIKYALEWGMIQEQDVERIDKGFSDFYYDYGITTKPEMRKLFRAYAIFYRVMPALPKKVRFFLLDKGIVNLFAYLPKTIAMFFIDLFLALRHSDPVSMHVMRQYFFWLKRILFQGGVKAKIDPGTPPRPRAKTYTELTEHASKENLIAAE